MTYAGFWRRLAALLVEGLLWAPMMGLMFWAQSQSLVAAGVAHLAFFFGMSFYLVYCNARWGQTIGKMAAGIRVVHLDGSPLTLRTALVRSSVDIVLGLFSAAVSVAALAKLDNDAYVALDWMQRGQAFSAVYPSLQQVDTIANYVWAWNELLVMLLNKRRRALHDFLAGTVVVVVPPRAASSE